MPKFEIEQYEIHSVTYRVEANSVKEALIEIMNGGGDRIYTEYVEVLDSVGVDRNILDDKDIEEIEDRTGCFCYDRIPGIMRVTEVKE